MGPILKTLFGLFLIVWIAIGIAIIAGGTVLSIQLPRLINNAQTSLSSLTTSLTGSNNPSSSPSTNQQQVAICASKSISTSRLQQIQNGSQPTTHEKSILNACGAQL